MKVNPNELKPVNVQSYPTPASIVRVERMGPHFTKYHLGAGKVVHHFTAADDQHYHDHRRPFRTSILAGGYVELIAEPCAGGTLSCTVFESLPGTTHEVKAGTIHKLTGLLGADCWTLIEPGEKEREPGFYQADEVGVWHQYW